MPGGCDEVGVWLRWGRQGTHRILVMKWVEKCPNDRQKIWEDNIKMGFN